MPEAPCSAALGSHIGSLGGSRPIVAPGEEWEKPPDYSLSEMLGAGIERVNDRSFFVSVNPSMRRIRKQVEKIASFDIPVLILGESGTGKEVLAQLIHSRSPRAQYPFLKVNCAALPETLLESELFGYERGAFTGALRSKPGQFENCNGGTILLDEIAEMSPALQAKFLHVLQDMSFSRLGGDETVTLDVRILAATNVDIGRAIESHRLREDLYYRLNTFKIQVPPLRSRPDEIPLLFEHFMQRFAADYRCPQISPSRVLINACMNYPWPGNVRELEGFVRRLLIQRDEAQALSELQANAPRKLAPDAAIKTGPNHGLRGLKLLARSVKNEAERDIIARALHEFHGNRAAAARFLNISKKTLYNKIKAHGLDKSQLPASACPETEDQSDSSVQHRIAPDRIAFENFPFYAPEGKENR